MSLFQNRKRLNKIMYVMAILIIMSMIILTVGPMLFSK
jgi:hypothetical protein